MTMRITSYVNIEITGCRVLYSKSIAGRGIVRFVSWLGTAESVDSFNRLFDCYIRVYQSFQFLLVEYSQLLVGPILGYAPETRHLIDLQDFKVYLRDHAH